jgi:hypothetical protein
MRGRLLALALACMAICGVAMAQETTTGSIAGIVLDSQGAPVPGATVTISSDQGAKTYTTGDDGRFFAPYLTPGSYTVRVELSGFSTIEQRGVLVQLGQRVTLTGLELKPGTITEAIQVQAAAPVVDATSTTVGGVLNSDTIKRLPVGRNFTDTLYLVPGVSDSSGVGRANPSIGGASGLENNYIIDGVNVSNPGYGGVGTYSIIFGSLGTGVTTDFIKETQVKTAGFEAEFGQATGGVVNVVTRSGSNNLTGNAFGYFRSFGTEANWKQLVAPNGTVNTTGTQNADYGIGIGGRVVKDKLFFYGSVNPQYQTRKVVAPSTFPLANLGELDRKRHTIAYAAKGTYQQSSNHRFDVTVFGDPSKGDNGPQRPNALLASTTGRFSSLEYGGHNQAVHYDGIITSRWLVEGSFSHAKSTFTETPALQQHSYTDTTVTPNVLFGGIGAYDKGQPGRVFQYQAKSTNLFTGAGNHQVRYGVQVEDVEYTRETARTGPSFTLSNGTATRDGASVSIQADPVYGKIYRATRANFGPFPTTTQKYTSFFLQDTWQIGKRLTLKPGVRYEQQKLVGGDPPLCHANDTKPGAGDGTGDLIHCSFKWDNNWGPRIGGTFDMIGNGRSKLYGSFGRFYAKIPNDLAARSLSADAGISRGDYFDQNLSQPVPEGVTALGVTRHLIVAGSSAAIIDPDSKSTYINESLAGFEFELAPNLSLGARFIYRDMPRILEDIGTAQMVLYDLLPSSALGSVEYFITNVNRNTPTFPAPAGVPQAHFEDPEHKYRSFEVTLTKLLSNNWTFIGSYRWSKLSGNFEGFYRSDNGQSDPAITSLFDFPTNDPSYTQVGGPEFGYEGDIRYLGCSLGCKNSILPNDRPHQVKLYGAYQFKDFNVGAAFNAGSGRSLTNLAANPNYNNAGEIPLTLRGAGIETALDGFKRRGPMDLDVSLHADYGVRMGPRRLMLIADLFNILNRQEPDNYDNCSERNFQVPNTNYGYPLNGCIASTPSYQPPFAARFAIRFEF